MLEKEEERVFYRQAVCSLFDVYDQQLVGKYTRKCCDNWYCCSLIEFKMKNLYRFP